ncbi:MAG TPA: translocation/assembly module TamB domain-containing protein [Steroidobacteraceae bacterium]|jgi:translocation and assembly module TamB|nr:translocation/assembly module TamB domain-containing protein [Steroidobacteraceae bacterium]
MKRRLKIAALIVGLLALLVLLFLAWVLYTEAGLRFAVARLPEHLGKVTLKIEKVHGTIAGGFGADRVDVDQERAHVRVENGAARVNFWPLLVGRIAVRDAHADQVLIEVKRRLVPPPKTPPKFLPRLLSISAESASTPSLVITAPSGKRVEFNDVSGSGIVGSKTIKVFDGSIIYGVLRSRAIGVLTAADPMKLSGEATTHMIIEGQPGWRADASFDGTLDELPLTAKLQEPFRADMRGELLELSSNFHWVGKADVHNFDLQTFGGGSALGIITGTLDVGGEMNAFHARGPLAVPGLGAGAFDVVFEGNYSDRVVNATHYEITHKGTGSHVAGQGTIETATNGPKLLLYGDWRGLRWPLVARFTAETPQIFSSPAGKYRLEGLWPYGIAATGDLFIPQIDPMTVAMRGALHKDHLQIAELELGAFGGKAMLSGEARWNPAESWTLEGSVKGFNPAALRPGFDGALDFNMKAAGAPFGTGGNLDFAFSNLNGKLRGNAATGSGRVALHGDDWTFDSLRFRAGNTSLAIDGDIGASSALNLQFSLDADNLALLAEGARGELHASGKIGGTAEAPIVKLTASGNGLKNGTLSVDKLAANVDLDWRGQRASHADIAISQLTVDQRSLTQFNATLDGTTANHIVRADALAGKTSLHMSGKGGFADGVWAGTIGDLFIDDTANINLQLDTPVKVRASAKEFKLDSLCMHGKVARLCGEAAWNEGTWSARADAHNLPISTLTAGLTPNVEYQGSVNATANASSTGGAPFVGKARVDLVDAAIRHKLASGRTDVITFGSGFVTLEADAAQLNAELRLDAAQRGLVSGRMRADRVTTDIMASPMRGQLQMATGELGFLTLYFPDIDRASGHFDANMSFAGTLGTPSASGVIKLSGAELDLYQLNLALRGLEMEARIASNNLEFSSTAKAGAGTLASSGKIEWRDNLPYGEIRVNGENLRIVDVPEARIDASPDLDFRIAAREILVKGEVKLPLARIQPADLTNAVLPSADERLVGPTEAVEKDPFLVTSEITLTLGDKVTIETYGLSGHITGSITERTLPGEPTRATGELQVKDGQYTALARKLDIERGRLIFSGGLLADPAVDIRAVKVFPDVKAGVNVRGSLREPRLSFFSEPSVPQSQIVSLLLAGGSLQSVQDQKRAGTPGASQEVAGQAAALLASQLGSKLGIPDISVESTLSNETSLVLGKYLSPRLYVSYGVSLTESISTIKMRYTINDRWTITTESAKERAADLVFTIEK